MNRFIHGQMGEVKKKKEELKIIIGLFKKIYFCNCWLISLSNQLSFFVFSFAIFFSVFFFFFYSIKRNIKKRLSLKSLNPNILYFFFFYNINCVCICIVLCSLALLFVQLTISIECRNERKIIIIMCSWRLHNNE